MSKCSNQNLPNLDQPSIHPSTTFSLTEEAFPLRSLREVVNVWARGSGQASFNLKSSNGTADLQLDFQLGLPYEPHLHPPHHYEPVEPHPRCPQQSQEEGFPDTSLLNIGRESCSCETSQKRTSCCICSRSNTIPFTSSSSNNSQETNLTTTSKLLVQKLHGCFCYQETTLC